MTQRQRANQVMKVLASAETKEQKTIKLIELGILESDVQELFNLYEVEDDVLFTIGVEIECFNVDKPRFKELCRTKGVEMKDESYNHQTKSHFKMVTDASIEGDKAIECVSPVLRNKSGFDNLKKVCDALNESGAKVNRTTGLHVHVGLQNVDFETYKNCFMNYFCLEPAIDKFMANSRKSDNNDYCHSLHKLRNPADLKECKNHDDIRILFGNSRYLKLNPL